MKFILKANRNQGISLLEVTIALALLALVLITAAHIRFSLFDKDVSYQAELSSLVILRQAGMNFETGILPEGFTNTNGVFTNTNNVVTTTNYMETSDTYKLMSMLQTNNLYSLGLYRMDFDISAGNYRLTNEERFSMYGSRIKMQPPPWERRSLPEPSLSADSSSFQVIIHSTNTNLCLITVGGYITNASGFTNFITYGKTLTITAVPETNGSHTFIKWIVNPASNEGCLTSLTNQQTTVFVDDEITVIPFAQ